MSLTDARTGPTTRQLSTEPTTSRAWWFLGTLAVFRNPHGAPRTPAVIELTVPPGGSPPRHFHEELDDAFLLLEGEVVVRSGEQTVVARPGTYVVVPHGAEHTFRVTSDTPAKMLLVHDDDSFLQFIETVGTPTRDLRIPPPGEFDVDGDTIVRVSAEHGAPIVGPSLEETEARSYVDRAATRDDPEVDMIPPLADTSDMAQVHKVFRHAVAAAPSLIGTATDPERLDVVSAYYRNVLALLHAHHDGEDALIWPLLIERAPDDAAEVQRVAGQHLDVDSALTEASAAIQAWQQSGDEATRNAATDAVTALGSSLLPHLDEEEAFIVPLAAEHIYAPEWGELPGHALRNFSGDKLWLVLGLIRERMNAEQVAAMDDHMPPPVLAMWRQHESQFNDFVSQLRQSAT